MSDLKSLTRALAWFPDDDLIRAISPRDEMVGVDKAHYFSVGRSALLVTRLALLAAGKTHVESVLDLPCGHGRVTRHLHAGFPGARLTVCDLDRDGVDYCVRTFGAAGVYSKPDPTAIAIHGQFDLIWCGALLSNLPSERWGSFLLLFSALLAPGGVLVFSTQGRCTAERLAVDPAYGLPMDIARQVIDDYEHAGFGYREFYAGAGYGVSLASLAWVFHKVEQQPTLRFVFAQERGWDDHHDVIACQRV